MQILHLLRCWNVEDKFNQVALDLGNKNNIKFHLLDNIVIPVADPWLTSSHKVWVLLKQVVKRWHLQLYLCVPLQIRKSRTNEVGYVVVSFSIQMDWIRLTRWFFSTTVCRAKLFCTCRLTQVMRFGKTWKWQDCFSYSYSVISCCLSWVVHHLLVQFLYSLISSHKIGSYQSHFLSFHSESFLKYLLFLF